LLSRPERDGNISVVRRGVNVVAMSILFDIKKRLLTPAQKVILCLGVVGIAGVAFFNYRSNHAETFETVTTRVIHLAALAVSQFGFANETLWKHYNDSRLSDLQAAADSGRVVRKLTFARQEPVDYGGVGIFLREWALKNRVKIIFTSRSPKSLVVYVSASEADQAERYLTSLTGSSLNPFE
jgi:hypothetical protein